jgi:hypothetical protein
MLRPQFVGFSAMFRSGSLGASLGFALQSKIQAIECPPGFFWIWRVVSNPKPAR